MVPLYSRIFLRRMSLNQFVPFFIECELNAEFFIDCPWIDSSEIADGFGTLCTFTFGICLELIFESIRSRPRRKNNCKYLTHPFSLNPKFDIHQPILQKLRERAHMANNNILPLSETATRLSYFGPKIKSEIDELSALGVTRLVSRGSPSSSSSAASAVSEASPPPKHISPTPRSSEPQIYLSTPDSNAWQNYTHIQNFNVNINLNEGYYPHASGSATPVPQTDMSMLYQPPSHMQQQNQGLQLEMAPEAYYSYHQQSQYSGGYMAGSQHSQHHHHMASGHDMSTHQGQPIYDLNESWHNFMAPYKTS